MSDPNQIRINELARELEIKAKVLIDYLPEIGVTEKKTHSSSIDLEHAELVRKHFQQLADQEAAAEAAKSAPKAKPAASRGRCQPPCGPLPPAAAPPQASAACILPLRSRYCVRPQPHRRSTGRPPALRLQPSAGASSGSSTGVQLPPARSQRAAHRHRDAEAGRSVASGGSCEALRARPATARGRARQLPRPAAAPQRQRAASGSALRPAEAAGMLRQRVKDIRFVPGRPHPARAVPGRLRACVPPLRRARARPGGDRRSSRRSSIAIPAAPGRWHVRARTGAHWQPEARAPQAARSVPKPSPESLFMRASRLRRAVGRSLKSDSPKASENFIQCARAPAQDQAARRQAEPVAPVQREPRASHRYGRHHGSRTGRKARYSREGFAEDAARSRRFRQHQPGARCADGDQPCRSVQRNRAGRHVRRAGRSGRKDQGRAHRQSCSRARPWSP